MTAILSSVWLYILTNPWTVLSAIVGAAGLVFQIRRAFGKKTDPATRDRILEIALPLIEAGKVLAEKTKTPWDNVLVGVAEKIAGELKAEGLEVKPAAVVATIRPHEPMIAHKLAAKALKEGLK